MKKNDHDVVLVDADPQQSSYRWSQDRQEAKHFPTVTCMQASGKINQTIKDLDKRYKFVIVDVAGRDSQELRSGMLAANILICPCRPSQLDLDTLPHLYDVFNKAQDYNEDIKGFVVLNICPTNPVIKEKSQAKEFLEDFKGLTLSSTTLHDRKAYRDSISEGLSVTEWTDEKASFEITSLVEEIFK